MFHTQFDNAKQEDSELLYELVSDEDKKKYVCRHPGCGKFFRYKSEIVRHAATHSESRPFICQYDNCFKAFKRNDALENHIRSSHTKETPFVCPFPDCGMKFTTHGSFRYHVLKHNRQHPDIETPMENFEEAPKKHIKLNSPSTSASSDAQPIQPKVDPIFQKLGFDNLGEEYYVPPPRFAGEMKWEFVNDDVESETQKTDEQQNQLTSVLEENKVLKQKLNTSEKVIKSMQKQINDLLGSLFAYQNQLNGVPEEPTLENFPSLPPQNSVYEPLFQEQEQIREEPLLEMINYNESKNLPSPSNFKHFNSNLENNSLDAFFSFNREIGTFEF